jgi:hypothetical protein
MSAAESSKLIEAVACARRDPRRPRRTPTPLLHRMLRTDKRTANTDQAAVETSASGDDWSPPVLIQAFVAEAAVEGFDVHVWVGLPGAINRGVTPPVVRPGQHRAAAELEPVVRPQELGQMAFHGQSIEDPRHRWRRTLNRNATSLRWSPALVTCPGLPGRSRKQRSRSTGRYRHCRTGHALGHDRSRQSSGILLLLV